MGMWRKQASNRHQSGGNQMKENIIEWLRANIKAVDPLQPIREWMEQNPDIARLYGEN